MALSLSLVKNVRVFPKDFDARIQFEVKDQFDHLVDLVDWLLVLYGDRDVVDEDPSRVERVGEGVFDFKYEKDKLSRFRELFLELKGKKAENPNEDFFYVHLFKPITPVVMTYIIYLRNQIDKALKSVGRSIDEFFKPDDNVMAVDKTMDSLPFGYSDEHCVLYLELGLSLINARPPYTAFTLEDFPFAVAGNLLIDGATIAALESQGLFSIDTDFDYSLGGKSFVVRHADQISSFLREIAERFNNYLRMFKSMYRTKGTVMVQVPFGWGFGRFLSVVPTGWFARFGLGVTRLY
jgi:hypothetical protein